VFRTVDVFELTTDHWPLTTLNPPLATGGSN
jgi:hypothetical protein